MNRKLIIFWIVGLIGLSIFLEICGVNSSFGWTLIVLIISSIATFCYYKYKHPKSKAPRLFGKIKEITHNINNIAHIQTSNVTHSKDEGCLNGVFSIGVGRTVRFSQGNLQYVIGTQEWQFAKRQYDVLSAKKMFKNPKYDRTTFFGDPVFTSSAYGPIIDMFAPSSELSNFGVEFGYFKNQDKTFVDWGNNKIINGGDARNAWRTLTQEEWRFLAQRRRKGKDYPEFFLYGTGVVNSIGGTILLPDNWENPQGINFGFGSGFPLPKYTQQEWNILEQSGAVFLPGTMEIDKVNGKICFVDQYREEDNKKFRKEDGNYWLNDIKHVIQLGNSLDCAAYDATYHNRTPFAAVRLVRDQPYHGRNYLRKACLPFIQQQEKNANIVLLDSEADCIDRYLDSHNGWMGLCIVNPTLVGEIKAFIQFAKVGNADPKFFEEIKNKLLTLANAQGFKQSKFTE